MPPPCGAEFPPLHGMGAPSLCGEGVPFSEESWDAYLCREGVPFPVQKGGSFFCRALGAHLWAQMENLCEFEPLFRMGLGVLCV